MRQPKRLLVTKLKPSLSGKPASWPFSVTMKSFSGTVGDAAVAEIVGAVVGDGQRVLELAALGSELDARLVAEAVGVDLHLLVRVEPVLAAVGSS